MPAHRSPRGLKLRGPLRVADDPVVDAKIGGLGLDFAVVPPVLDEAGAVEWRRLAEVFADDETRFREGDRAALTAYCAYWSAFVAAAADVSRNGPVVPGRSEKDQNRLVKNPATVAMREAATQLRYWSRELGLTPDARARMGITDPDPKDPAERLLDNPFAAG
jgi:P27 family predicted phage terminase small subunit